jgi:hypothetical protein
MIWDSFEFPIASVLKIDARTGHQIDHCPRDEYLPSISE